ncbi:MAG: glycine cleavage system aminomethyltransferase GcvT [Burkholderiaceae bacterium]
MTTASTASNAFQPDTPPAAQQTALHALHLELGARMVPFAGYDMPVQYPMGVLQEHLHTRSAAGLFDVSHMGQLKLVGPHAAEGLELLVPMDIMGLARNQQRYALFTNEAGGILDDLMVTHCGDYLFVVVNAACKVQDTAHLRAELGGPGKPGCDIVELDDHALLALQGPEAMTVMARLCPDVDFGKWTFMTARDLKIGGIACFVTRSGYTGEDGFEISVENRCAEELARLLLLQPEVAPVGLGARDSLRLEAGLCLYGNDIDIETTPVEASLTWAISKARRADGARPGGFPGAKKILAQLASGKDGKPVTAEGVVSRKRVGLVGVERTPVRAGSEIVAGNGDDDGAVIGRVTSGTLGPTAQRAVALGYVSPAHAAIRTEVMAVVRGKPVAMRVTATPFVPHRYYRG